MKPRPHSVRLRLLSLLLAGLVLLSSVGLAAERHRCRISGRSTVALELPGRAHRADAPDPACGSQRAAKRRANGCCDVTHTVLKLDAKRHAGPAASWLPKSPQWLPAWLPAPAWVGHSVAAAVPAGVAVGTAGGPSPPGWPRAGRTLLTFVCTLVV